MFWRVVLAAGGLNCLFRFSDAALDTMTFIGGLPFPSSCPSISASKCLEHANSVPSSVTPNDLPVSALPVCSITLFTVHGLLAEVNGYLTSLTLLDFLAKQNKVKAQKTHKYDTVELVVTAGRCIQGCDGCKRSLNGKAHVQHGSEGLLYFCR